MSNRLKLRFVIRMLLMLSVILMPAQDAAAQDRYELADGDTVGVTGNAFAEHLSRSGYFEALLQAAHPNAQITVRSVPWGGDEVGLRIRETNVPTAEDRMDEYDADVVFMFIGMSESFKGEGGIEQFEQELADHIDDYQSRRFNGESAPRLVLVSPITHEDLGPPLPTGAEVENHNASLAAYTEVMGRVAEEKGVRFLDLLAPSQRLYAELDAALTSNGIHPNELGCFYLAKEIGEQLGWMEGDAGTADAADALRTLASDKFYHERLIYAATNTEYVWGQRREPFGSVNFPEEESQLNRMVAARQQAMWTMDKPTPAQLLASPPSGPAVWEATPSSQDFPEDEWVPTPVDLIDRGGAIGGEIKPADEFSQSFALADGYIVECFASEQEFEELANPLALTFDDRGRLWVLVSPTYPHVLPGERPDCKLLILEDTDGNGKADAMTIFARYMDIPTGFAIDGDGVVYVGQAPYLFKLTDTDGDDVADRKETIYTGFGMPDSHHTISAFAWEPGGALVMHEGWFTRTNIETPRGTQRTQEAACWRFDPRTLEMTAISHSNYPNPWGHTVDEYGQGIFMETSGAAHNNIGQAMAPFVYPHKPASPPAILRRGRPNAGSEIIYSRHFPEDVQGTYVHCQVIGFNGTRWDRLHYDGDQASGYTTEQMPQDLMSSPDANYRPVGCELGPDGTLYIIDWCNPLIGHMQFSVRDPRRDRTHGRVWRIRHADRPLVETPNIAQAGREELLELLRAYEQNTRDRARRRLQRDNPAQVLPMVDSWLSDLDEDDPDYARLMLEGLWIHQAHGSINLDLLADVVDLDDANAVAAGVRVIRYWLQLGYISDRDAERRLRRLTDHDDMRVRLEVLYAVAFLADNESAIEYLEEIAEMPMDEAMRTGLQETLRYLEERPQVGAVDPPDLPRVGIVEKSRLWNLTPEELVAEGLEAEFTAQVVLERPDVPFPHRRQALTRLAGDNPQQQARALVTVLVEGTLYPDQVARSVAELLMSVQPEGLAVVAEQLEAYLDDPLAERRALATAVLVRSGQPLKPFAERDRDALLGAVAAMSPEQLPASAVEDLKQLVDGRTIDTAAGMAEVARLSLDKAALFAWLASMIDPARGLGYDQWGDGHTRAMAALAAMHRVDAADWPPGYDDYWLPPVNPEVFAEGYRLYHLEEEGCVKCHGEHGEGVEGFPPLAQSPWVLGDPRRGATIVAHGLTGPLTMPDGQTFDATMDPVQKGSQFSDADVAAILSYVRQSFGNYASAVTYEDVRTAAHPEKGSWHTDALLMHYPMEYDRLLPSSDAPKRPGVAQWRAPGWGLPLMLAAVIGLNVLFAGLTFLVNRQA